MKRTYVILILISWATNGLAQDIQARGKSPRQASALLGEAADLDLPFNETADDGRGSAAAGWNRRLAGLDPEERFELLREWSMPTESRRSFRVLTAITPTDAPPAVFARALGERPRRDSFATPEIGEVQGLFCSAWELVKVADDTGKLRGLTTELASLVDDGVANARSALLLARIRAARRFEQPLLDELTSHADAIADRSVVGDVQPPSEQPALGGPVASDVDLALAAACLTQEWLRPIGEKIYKKQLAEIYDRESRIMRPFLRQALATAVRKRYPEASREVTGTSNLDLWVPSSGKEAARNAQGAVPSTWLSLENQVLHLAGPRSDYLFLKYPLTGEFEFSCEAQIGGRGGTDGGIGYGGLGYELWGAKQLLRVWTASHEQVASVESRFVANHSLATFNHFSLKSAANGVTLSCNRHPTWTDAASAAASPWIALRCYGSSAPVFRNLQLTGEPVIPREVNLSAGDSLRGWTASYYGERAGTEDSDWFLKDEVVHGIRRDATANSQSRLYYLRPLLDGESISYEFQYEAGNVEVHPALGRIAFLIEADGVRLHWMTDGDREWTGLPEDNTVVEPLNRRGRKPLPLTAGQWNNAALALKNDTLTLSLNGMVIYTRKMEPREERTFGFYHDANRTEARVRNVVMRGDWPEKLTPRQLDNLAAADTERSKSDRRVLGAIFDDRHIHGSVLEVLRRAAAMQTEQRYEFLSDWVLPSDDHETLRLALDFTPTNPGPPAAANGGELVAPALDLVAAAKALGRLQELQDRVASLAPTDEDQQRARSSMLALIATASGDFDIANKHLQELAELVIAGTHSSFLDRGPETVAIAGTAALAETRDAAREIAWHLLQTQIRKQRPSGSEAWDQHLDSLANRLQFIAESGGAREKDSARQLDHEPLADWHPVSYATARTRGQGLPRASWHLSGHQIRKTSGHEQDYLYYRVPLRGDYEVECDLSSTSWQSVELMVAGNWVGPWWDRKAYVFGNFRERQPLQALEVPLAGQKNQWARYRAVVRNGTCTTYFNGRKLHVQPLTDDCEPWLAIRGTGNSHGAIRDLRIAGTPIVPRQINLATSSDLPGWISYFEGSVGPQGDWRLAGDGIVEIAQRDFGSFDEQLLRYHRPMIEDGIIEYDFYYRAGEAHVHPAFDRLAFILQPAGVGVHWITDGPFDRTGLAPDNLFEEPDSRRGGDALLLKSDDWNRLRLTLTGDTVDLALNGESIYQRELEPSNLRTFGLFHYADRNAARVRNIVWRGEWPRELPAVARQELAANEADFLDESLPALTATFDHDFAARGLPSNVFGVSDGRTEHFDTRPEGLLVTRGLERGYNDSAFGPLLNVEGDFDIVAEFEQFDPRPVRDGSCGVFLEAAFDDDDIRCLLLLRHFWGSTRSNPIIRAAYNDRKIGGVRRDRLPGETTEATAGRLRLARRGDTVYFLFAEYDSPIFRLMGTQDVAKDEPATVRLGADTQRESLTKVVWKRLTIRANKLSGLALLDQQQLLTDLNGQRDALARRFEHDFATDPLTANLFGQWGTAPPRVEANGALVVALGTNGWTSAGVSPQLGLIGDFDVSVTFRDLALAEPSAGKYSEFNLRLTFSDESHTQALISFVEKTGGGPQIFAQVYVLDAGGNPVYRRVRLDSVDAIDGLRLARRGKQLSFIYRKAGSDRDQILTQSDIDDGPVAQGNIRLQLHTGGAGRLSQVLLTKLRVDAQQIDPSPSNTSPLLEALVRQLTGELPKHALEFNGRAQYVTIPDLRYDGSHPITLEAFVTPDELRNCILADTQRAGVGLSIMSPRGSYNMHAWTGTDLDRALTDASSATRFHRVHVAGTFDGETVRIFVNGKLEKTSPVNGRFTGSGLPMMIGASPSPLEGGIDFPFDGLIDLVRISSTVRYTKDFAVPREFSSDESTLALFRFDEGTGETLGDASGRQNDGLIRGAQWVTGDAIRHRAALGLVAFGRFAVPFLAKALDDGNPSVQLEAIAALGTIGPDARAAVKALAALADDDDERVRSAASRAVILIESKDVAKPD